MSKLVQDCLTIRQAATLAAKLERGKVYHTQLFLKHNGIDVSVSDVMTILASYDIKYDVRAEEQYMLDIISNEFFLGSLPDEEVAVETESMPDIHTPIVRTESSVKCQACGRGYLEIDENSFDVQIESSSNDGLELSAEVKGYCMNCNAEHIFSTQGYADCQVNK